MPVIGFLASSSADAPSGPLEAVHLGLKQAGYPVGPKVRFEYRYANNQVDRLPQMVVHERALRHMFRKLPGRKIVFSNAPRHYVEAVLTAAVMVMAASVIPARRAARLEPLETLRLG